jgi:hypothetical protein
MPARRFHLPGRPSRIAADRNVLGIRCIVRIYDIYIPVHADRFVRTFKLACTAGGAFLGDNLVGHALGFLKTFEQYTEPLLF